MAKLPLTKQFVLFPFCPSSFVQMVSFAERELCLQFVCNQLVGGQPWKSCVRCTRCVGGRRFLVGRWAANPAAGLASRDFVFLRSFDWGFYLFFQILRLRLLSFLLTNLCIVALQVCISWSFGQIFWSLFHEFDCWQFRVYLVFDFRFLNNL